MGDTQVSQNDINQLILSQLARLGDRLTNIESNQAKFTKKTVHLEKGTSSTKNKSAKGVVSHASQNHASLASTGSKFVAPTVPPPRRLREEARIQQEVQKRLTHLADRAKSGMDRVKVRSGSPMNLFYLAKTKIELHTIKSVCKIWRMINT